MDAMPGSTVPPASVQGLLDLLEKAGGYVQVLDPLEQVRAAWRRLIHRVRSGGHVLKGCIWFTGAVTPAIWSSSGPDSQMETR